MRGHGVVEGVPGAAPRDHICWAYADQTELHAAGVAFLAGGLERGERLLCVGDRIADGLRQDPSPLGEHVDALTARGALQVLTLPEAYVAAGGFSAPGQWAFYDDATRRARADGYTGLRVLADVSDLAGDPEHHEELLRWEHLGDRFIATGPGMSAMCTYRADLPGSALADVASVHPLVHGAAATAPFRLFVEGGRLALLGEVDALGAERLNRILGSSPVHAGANALDLRGVTFADVAACRVIARWARSVTDEGGEVQLWNAPALLRRTWRLLGLGEWATVSFAAAA